MKKRRVYEWRVFQGRIMMPAFTCLRAETGLVGRGGRIRNSACPYHTGSTRRWWVMPYSCTEGKPRLSRWY
jgi:hypothetical protein